MENAGRSFEELEQITLGGLRRAVQEGDVVHGSVMCGQSAGLVHEILSCQEILERMEAEAEKLLTGGRHE